MNTSTSGVGKTTLIKKLCEILKEQNYQMTGFFTEEVRENRERIGFDIVLVDGRRAPLARITSSAKGPKVGKYTVNLNSLERLCLPQFTGLKSSILILDEIGKMELLSVPFKNKVSECFTNCNQIILGTVPIKTATSIPLIEKMKSHPNTKLITVDRENRNSLIKELMEYINEAVRSS